ncbi:MAG: enoyl-CoA hydratase/isomerase family protein [Pseudomonadota bacterium]
MADVDFTVTDDRVAVLTMRAGENRLNPSFIAAIIGALDEIETSTGAEALVAVSAHEKIFSNGIDLDWTSGVQEAGREDELKAFFYDLGRLFRRVLLFPLPTTAAVNGHAFAAGAVLALTFDFRFMRSDRGYFCFPEVDLGIPFLPSALAICGRFIPPALFHEMQLTGRRLTGLECRDHGLARAALPRDEVTGAALDFAARLGKKRAIVAEMKARACRGIIRALEVEDRPYIESGKFHY